MYFNSQITVNMSCIAAWLLVVKAIFVIIVFFCFFLTLFSTIMVNKGDQCLELPTSKLLASRAHSHRLGWLDHRLELKWLALFIDIAYLSGHLLALKDC